MKNALLALMFFALFSCNNDASKSEAVAAADSVAAPAAPANGSLEFEGPEIDLMKKLVGSYEKADFQAARSCYSDSARYFENQWVLDSTQTGVSVDEMIAEEKKYFDEFLQDVNMGTPIYEVVTTKDGIKYGHVWLRFKAKNKKTGKMLDIPMFSSFGFDKGKLAWEWNIHDTKQLQ